MPSTWAMTGKGRTGTFDARHFSENTRVRSYGSNGRYVGGWGGEYLSMNHHLLICLFNKY